MIKDERLKMMMNDDDDMTIATSSQATSEQFEIEAALLTKRERVGSSKFKSLTGTLTPRVYEYASSSSSSSSLLSYLKPAHTKSIVTQFFRLFFRYNFGA